MMSALHSGGHLQNGGFESERERERERENDEFEEFEDSMGSHEFEEEEEHGLSRQSSDTLGHSLSNSNLNAGPNGGIKSRVGAIMASHKKMRRSASAPSVAQNDGVVKKRNRTTPEQLLILEEAFEGNPTPTAQIRELLAEKVSMTPRSVQIWFQNRRAKIKHMEKKGQVPNGGYGTISPFAPMGAFSSQFHQLRHDFQPGNQGPFSPPKVQFVMSQPMSHLPQPTSPSPLNPSNPGIPGNPLLHHPPPLPPPPSSSSSSSSSSSPSNLGNLGNNGNPGNPGNPGNSGPPGAVFNSEMHRNLQPGQQWSFQNLPGPGQMRRANGPPSGKTRAVFNLERLKVGTWTRLTMSPGDLLCKADPVYQTLCWEIVEGPHRCKIEIKFTQITSLEVQIVNEEISLLSLFLNEVPSFFLESKLPDGRPAWKPCNDITEGQQATQTSKHVVQAQTTLIRHYLLGMIQSEPLLVGMTTIKEESAQFAGEREKERERERERREEEEREEREEREREREERGFESFLVSDFPQDFEEKTMKKSYSVPALPQHKAQSFAPSFDQTLGFNEFLSDDVLGSATEIGEYLETDYFTQTSPSMSARASLAPFPFSPGDLSSSILGNNFD